MELIQSSLRLLQLLFLIILTGLIGNVIATNISAAGSATAAINFSMFVLVVSWLACLIGFSSKWLYDRIAALPVVVLGLDFLATLFTFIAGVVLAAKLKVVNCSNTNGYPADWIAYGSGDDTKRCREVQASTAFMWFLFVTFTVSLVLTFFGFRRGTGSGVSGVGSSVRGGMSQVRV